MPTHTVYKPMRPQLSLAMRRRIVAVLAAVLLMSGPAFSPAALPTELILGTADTEPYSNADLSGLYDRVLAEVGDRLGIEIVIRRFPSKRSMLETAAGRLDGEFARTRVAADAYPALLVVPAPLADFQFVAVGRAGAPVPTSFADLADYHVGFINGWRIYEEQVTLARSVTTVADEARLFRVLREGRVDVVLYSRYRARSWRRRQPAAVGSEIQIADTPLSVQPVYLLVHERHAEHVTQLAAAIASVTASPAYTRWHSESFGFPPAGEPGGRP